MSAHSSGWYIGPFAAFAKAIVGIALRSALPSLANLANQLTLLACTWPIHSELIASLRRSADMHPSPRGHADLRA